MQGANVLACIGLETKGELGENFKDNNTVDVTTQLADYKEDQNKSFSATSQHYKD